MIQNFELVSITTIILILILISLYPLIYLKYVKDLNNNISKYNTVCNHKKSVYKSSNLKIRNTYMWNLSTYIFDFNRISKNFNKQDADDDNDKKPINRHYDIVNGELNIMKVYNDYLYYSIPLFIALWLVFFLNIAVVFGNRNNENIDEPYSIIFTFINVAIFTIIFSLVLKKITEIYMDTYLYDYIMLLKELDIIIKEDRVDNRDIIDKIKDYSEDEDIKSIADIPIDKRLFRELVAFKGLVRSNNNNYNLTLQNIDKFELYNSKETINKINGEIDDVTQYISAYFILIFMSIYILSQAIKSNFLLISVIIILIYILYIISVASKKKLE